MSCNVYRFPPWAVCIHRLRMTPDECIHTPSPPTQPKAEPQPLNSICIPVVGFARGLLSLARTTMMITIIMQAYFPLSLSLSLSLSSLECSKQGAQSDSAPLTHVHTHALLSSLFPWGVTCRFRLCSRWIGRCELLIHAHENGK